MKRRLALTAVCLITAASMPLTSANAAQSRTISAQQTYTCQNAADTYTSSGELGVSMKLTVPAQVAAGSTVSLRGEFALRFPEKIRKHIVQWQINKVEGYSDTLSSAVTINGRRTSFRADRWQTGPTAVEDPMVIRAPITFPAYRVPADSDGKLSVALPQNGFTKNISTEQPAKVAFTTEWSGEGNGPSYRSKASCYVAKGAPNVLGSIPIRAAASSPADAAGSDGARRGSSGDASSTPDPDVTRGWTPDRTEAFSVGSKGKRSGAQSTKTRSSTAPKTTSARPTHATARTQSDNAAPPPDTAQHSVTPTSADGVRVPTAVLWLGAIGVCGIALAYAAWTNYRLRLMRAEHDN